MKYCPNCNAEDPQDEGLKTWVGKFIRTESDDEGRDIAFSSNLTLETAIALEQSWQLARIADALEYANWLNEMK